MNNAVMTHSNNRLFISYGHGGEKRTAESLERDLPQRVAAAQAQMHNLLQHHDWAISTALRWQREPHSDFNPEFLSAQADTDIAQFKFLHEMLWGLFNAARDLGIDTAEYAALWNGLTERGNAVITRHHKFLKIFDANR